MFFFIMFGAIGIQLFMGQLKYRCYNGAGEYQYDDDGYQTICNPSDLAEDSSCNEGFVCIEAANPNHGITSFDNIFAAIL
jgi:hypothetical protein